MPCANADTLQAFRQYKCVWLAAVCVACMQPLIFRDYECQGMYVMHNKSTAVTLLLELRDSEQAAAAFDKDAAAMPLQDTEISGAHRVIWKSTSRYLGSHTEDNSSIS